MNDAGWGDLGTPEGVFAALQNTTPASQTGHANAFDLWLAGYRHQLEGLCDRKANSAAEPR